MPAISSYLFSRFGISVYMYYGDIKMHHHPHVHVRFQGKEAVVGIPDGNILDGSTHRSASRKVKAWIELNSESLVDMWQKAVKYETIGKID